MAATRLTPNFTLEELIASDTAAANGIDNKPSPEHLANLKVTALGLEMVRLIVGAPIVITSGYRSKALNQFIYEKSGKPATQSAHTLGFAADFHSIDPANRIRFPLATTARTLMKLLPYDQLIFEPGRCVHISFDPRLRGQVLTQRVMGGPTLPGIVE